jgi:hypothetical protein
MNLIDGRPRRQLTHHWLGIGSRTDADVVAFDGADEGFSHSVALRTFEGHRSRFKADVASEAAGTPVYAIDGRTCSAVAPMMSR